MFKTIHDVCSPFGLVEFAVYQIFAFKLYLLLNADNLKKH